ncbi:MAG TPA: phosphoribosyltransferase [Chloroflexota bacterium]|jgi:putative phosphoribosyl transferase|nr:phosphoribosyltransferase [Chloroflexota bacterium]
MAALFTDRAHAGRELAMALERYRGPSTLVLGLPRGGVVVADEVARTLDAELNVIITRKIGAPGNPEYAIGAVAEGGGVVLNEEDIALYRISRAYVEDEIRRQQEEIARRITLYREGAPLPPMHDRPTLVVDDGVATGYTMLAALRSVRQQEARPVVMATPVIPPSTLERLSYECDDAVALASPEPFYAVGLFYENFEQLTDEDVIRILTAARSRHAA